MRFFRVIPTLIAVSLGLVLAGCSIFGDSEWPPTELPAASVYQIRPSDKLFVQMYMEPESSKEAAIAVDGTANLYLIGQVKLAGLTRDQATEKVIQLYKQYYKEPKVNIEIKEYALRKVTVDGFVNKAGPVLFLMEERMTLAQAIANAAGLQARGDSSEVKLTRILPDKSTKTWTINLKRIYSGEKQDVPLQEDDRIYVPDSII